MIIDLSISELLIVSLFFLTAFNCALTYFCCTKSLNLLEEGNCVSKAINKLRALDQYLLSKINMLMALFYFGLSYTFIESKMLSNDYAFLLACLLSFPLTLITTYASRICYCYTCNVLLDTKLNEIECFVVNFKRLLVIYFPFVIISFVVPTVYLFGLSEVVSNIICLSIFVIVLILWIFLTPKAIAISYRAKEIPKNSLLRHRLDKLMEKHGIKKYKLYKWDSSRSKESNAMVSGIAVCHLFISSCLIEEVTLPELETVITHELGHVKHNHLLKMMIGKLFVIASLVVLAVVPYMLDLGQMEKGMFYLFIIMVVCVGIIIGVKIEKKYELQADMYAACYNDPELFASALRKITKYEEDEESALDSVFQSHPSTSDRIEKVKKDED